MRTNVDKWNHYLALINQNENAFIKSVLPDPPKKLFKVWNSGEIQEFEVQKIYYNNRLFVYRNTTRLDVQRITKHFETDNNYVKEKVLLSLHAKTKAGGLTTGLKLTNINDYYRTFTEAEKIAAVKIEEKRQRQELLDNGHVACSYCSNVVKEEEAVDYTIIFQNSRPNPTKACGYSRFVDRKTQKYCSNKCGVHDQMAHEG